jgi:hypothetical protein
MPRLIRAQRSVAATLIIVLASVTAFALWLAFAMSIPNPVVVDDEPLFFITGLSMGDLPAARAMHAAIHPSGALLYPWIIHLLSLSHAASTVTAVKAFNVACFISAAVLLWMCARPLASGSRPKLLLVYLLAAPLGAYATYTMPECAYALGFAVAFAVLLQCRRRAWATALVVALLLALLTLIKPHGMMCMAVFAFTVLIAPMAEGEAPDPRRRIAIAATATAAFGVALVLAQHLLNPADGGHGADLLGPVYRTELGYMLSPAHLLEGGKVVLAYLCGVCVLLGPAIAVLGFAAVRDRRPQVRFPSLYLLLLLGALTLTSAVIFTIEAQRIHLRYVMFLFAPMLVMAVRAEPERPARGVRLLGAGLWLAGALGLAAWLGYYRPLPADASDLFFLDKIGWGALGLGERHYALLIGGCGVGAAALFFTRWRWLHVQLAVLGLFAAFAIPNVWMMEHDVWGEENAGARAVGALARQVCGQAPQDIVALGSTQNFVPLYQSLFVLNRPEPFEILPPPEFSRRLSQAWPQACLLTTGLAQTSDLHLIAQAGAVRLYAASGWLRAPFKWSMSFDQPLKSSVLAAGWSEPEPFGVWSDGRTADLTLWPAPIGREEGLNLDLELRGLTPPRVATQAVHVSVLGEPLADWMVSGAFGVYRVHVPARLIRPGAPLTLHLDLPGAVQPRAFLPGSADTRLLSVAIRRLEVATQPRP